MVEMQDSLRVALLAGTLARGGAEKQLVYMARALREAGVCVRVYTLGKNELYEGALRDTGLDPIGVGRAANPVLRLVTFARALRQFRPHIVQATHFYVNLYVALASRLFGSLAIGAVRNDVVSELQGTGRWGRLLLHMPHALIANSYKARCNGEGLGTAPSTIHVVPNVIDTSAFPPRQGRLREAEFVARHIVVVVVARLVQDKRLDRFLQALALARQAVPALKGVIVGVGAERASLEALAGRLALLPDGVEFRGACDDIPSLLSAADMLALTSDHEGFPNVILEAMAARLPVVTTPAGDAATIIEDGVSGFVVPFDAVAELADRLVRLARAPGLGHEFGEAGYQRVTARYAAAGLADRLLAVYRAAARHSGHREVLDKLALRPINRLGNS